MFSEEAAKEIAERFLLASRKVSEPELAIDWELTRVKQGTLIAPYNSAHYMETRNPRDQLLDCWPILVDMSTGQARFALLEEREFWRIMPNKPA
ncbi:hypothetical protein [Streptomyces sp. NBC_01174]|uniref:hypothetical protein n=1 Tax=Streptomyces sp. NBC_01174 TaxID=2903758 RepID=UPI002F91BEED|nr:hypothetical protein OG414_40805 [Streptomyces sp. NBC_01174]